MKKMGFILKGYPRVSETFIAQEIYLLEQLGFKIEIFSMRKAREPERQPIVNLIKAPVTYIPEYIFENPGAFLKANILCFARFPLRYTKALTVAIYKTAKLRDDSPIKRFLQAAWLVVHKNLGHGGVDHLHSHFAHTPTELAYYCSQISGLRYSISAHAKDIYTIPAAELRERINASELIMTCTEFNEQFMKKLPQVHTNKIHKVYHGINLENFKPSTEAIGVDASNLNNFISIGRLVPKKGYADIFEALRQLKERGVSFHYDIFGSGELKNQLHELRDTLGLSKEIQFHNTATHPQIIARLQKKGIFICGSRLGEDGDRDGIPNTLAEAMSMELPVLATKVSGIPELVEDKVSGILVEEKNPTALRIALEELLADPARAKELGQNARKRVEQVFNSQIWIHSCARLLAPFAGLSSEKS